MKPLDSRAECILCRCEPERSITIAGYHLCAQCEQLIVSSRVDDPHYGAVVESLRAFWMGLAEAAASRD